MIIAGKVKLSGTEYYLAWKNIKKSNTYFLYSKVHIEDLTRYDLTQEHIYPMIDSVRSLKSFTNENYILEIIEELKVSGRAKTYSKFHNSILTKILHELSFARNYKFSSEYIYTDDTRYINGKILKIFYGSDNNLSFKYEKEDDYFKSLEIKHGSFEVKLNLTNIIITSNAFKMCELDNYQKNEISILTLNSISFEKLANTLDLSWYYDKNTGKLFKKYEAIKTITDFEYKIMYPLCTKLKSCIEKGIKLNVTLDTETTGLNIYNLSETNADKDHCVAIPISWKINTGYVIFTDMEYFDNIPTEYAVSRLAELFEKFKDERTIKYYVPPKEYLETHTSIDQFVRTLDKSSFTIDNVEIESGRSLDTSKDEIKNVNNNLNDSLHLSASNQEKESLSVNETGLEQMNLFDFIDKTGNIISGNSSIDENGSNDNNKNPFMNDIKALDEFAVLDNGLELEQTPFYNETALNRMIGQNIDTFRDSVENKKDTYYTYEDYEKENHDTNVIFDEKSDNIVIKFLRSDINLIGHNILFDRRVFYMCGKMIYFDNDTLQMAFDLNPKTVRGSVALKGLTHRLLNHETPELSDLLGKGNEDKYKYLNDQRVAEVYGCADADYTLIIFYYLYELMSSSMYREYKRQDVPLLNILAISEYYGMRTMEKEVSELAFESEKNLDILKDFMYSYVGTYVSYINQRNKLSIALQAGTLTQEQYEQEVNSIEVSKNARYEFEVKASNIRHVLYDILGYKIYAWTDGKQKLPKTDKYVMKKLSSQKRTSNSRTFGTMTEDLLVYGADKEKYLRYKEKGLKNKANEMCLIKASDFNSCKNPLAIVLTKYAELNKEYTSYFKPIRETNMEGKIFKNYSLARIETRRIVNPGQTMKGKLKALIRSYTDDHYLLDFDMSQVEYRIMISIAHYAAMIRKMNHPECDYHTETASLVHGVPAHMVSKKLRKSTKCISFGVPYGLSERSLCDNLFGVINDDTLFQTRELLQKWLTSNKPVSDMLNEFRQEAVVEQEISKDLRNFMDAWKKDEDGEYLLDSDGNKIPSAIGMSKNLKGFYRVYDLEGMDNTKKASIQRAAGNYPIQSFAAEVFRIILIRFYERCEEEGLNDKIIWHMLIHDELLCSVHKSIHPFFIYKIVKEACMITLPGHTKYYVGINIGNTWAECKDDAREAPVLFVERIIKKWDNGDFGKGPFWFDDPWAFIEPYRKQYVEDRILEIVERLQPNVREAPIDVPLLLEKFSNYTVRSYVDDYKQNYEIKTKYDDSDEYEAMRHSDEIWASRLETWALNVFGSGKQIIDINGKLKTLYKDDDLVAVDSLTAINSNNLISGNDFVLNDDVKDLPKVADLSEDAISLEDLVGKDLLLDDEDDITMSSLFGDEGNNDNDYWEFDEEELRVSYDSVEEDESYVEEIQFDTENKHADNVAGYIKTEKALNNITVLNNQVIIKTKHYLVTKKCKHYLEKYKSKSGYCIIFREPNGLSRWSVVKKSVDLNKLDKWLTKANQIVS